MLRNHSQHPLRFKRGESHQNPMTPMRLTHTFGKLTFSLTQVYRFEGASWADGEWRQNGISKLVFSVTLPTEKYLWILDL
jgi:hypothetical protein